MADVSEKFLEKRFSFLANDLMFAYHGLLSVKCAEASVYDA